MKIKFMEDRVVLNGDGEVTESYRRGQVKEMSEASARHWINRSVAVIFVKAPHDGGKKKAAAKAAAPGAGGAETAENTPPPNEEG